MFLQRSGEPTTASVAELVLLRLEIIPKKVPLESKTNPEFGIFNEGLSITKVDVVKSILVIELVAQVTEVVVDETLATYSHSSRIGPLRSLRIFGAASVEPISHEYSADNPLPTWTRFPGVDLFEVILVIVSPAPFLPFGQFCIGAAAVTMRVVELEPIFSTIPREAKPGQEIFTSED
jgi:hypothetical protein